MSKHATALVLSGGGARGAYQVGVLTALAEAVRPGTKPFQIITGVSVGALNASVLAADADDFHRGVSRLETIWRNLHCGSVYRANRAAIGGQAVRWGRALLLGWAGAEPPRSILDNAPLRSLLEDNVDFDRLNAFAGGPELNGFSVTASSYETGRAITFFNSDYGLKPWHRARRQGRSRAITPDHIMASSALPLVFPAVRVEGEWFGDGALRDNAPLSAAIHLGCDHVVTIGARDQKPDEHTDTETKGYPSLGDIAGQLLDIVFNDNADTDVERLRRINNTISLIPEDKREEAGLKDIGLMTVYPATDIRRIAGKHADELPSAVKTLLKTIGAYKAPWVLPSYLTFEPGYINNLIDQGYQDGQRAIQENGWTFAAD